MTMKRCQHIYKSWEAVKDLRTPTWKKMVFRSNLQETLVAEIFCCLKSADFSLDKLKPDLKDFLRTCASSWGSTGMVEDSFQRLRTAESRTPTTRLSGMQAWSVPIEKSVLSSVYDFEELQGDECPELQADDELVSDSFFHQRVRDMSMKEWLICIYSGQNNNTKYCGYRFCNE